jgi:hypothetical protein
MKHRGAEKVREQTKDMTLKQELAFWQERSRILKQRQEVAKGNCTHQRTRSSELRERRKEIVSP